MKTLTLTPCPLRLTLRPLPKISELSPEDPAAASSSRIRLLASSATDWDDRDTRPTDCCFVDVPNHEPAPGTTHPLPGGSPICPPRRGTPFASATPPSSGARGRGCSPPPRTGWELVAACSRCHRYVPPQQGGTPPSAPPQEGGAPFNVPPQQGGAQLHARPQ